MSTDITIRVPARLQTLAVTALLLERLDRTPRSASAEQYQQVTRRIQDLLAQAQGDPALPPLLDAMPALSELYENRHYDTAGLCRSPLDDAVRAETQVTELLTRLRRKPS